MHYIEGARIWTRLDKRLEEAESVSIGLEAPLSWYMGIQVFALNMLTGLSVLIASYGMGEVIDKLIPFFGEYDDDELLEPVDDDLFNGNTGNIRYKTGDSADKDLVYHL